MPQRKPHPDHIQDVAEIEGAFLSCIATFREIGIKVWEGSSGASTFTFYVYTRSEKRFEPMAELLMDLAFGYEVEIGKMLYKARKGSWTYRWMVRVHADNIVVATDAFRRTLYAAHKETTHLCEE